MSERSERVSPDEWRKRVERWKDSGLTAQEFSSELGINHRSLTAWSSRLRNGYSKGKNEAVQARNRGQRNGNGAAVQFVELTKKAEGGSDRLEIIVGKHVIRLQPGFDENALSRLLTVMEAR